MALAEAMVGDDPGALARAGEAVRQRMGPDAFLDAVAVASNFERMVRIADATGIPLDAPVNALSGELRRDLGLDRFAAAAHTPASGAGGRLLARALRPVLAPLLRAAGRRLSRLGP